MSHLQHGTQQVAGVKKKATNLLAVALCTLKSAALNAADEVMVKAFLDRKLGFLGIAETIERVLERMTASGDLNEARSIVDVMAVDAAARQVSLEELSRIAH